MSHDATRFAFALAMIFVIGTPAASNAGALQVGVATADITPPVGYRMSGYFHERFSTGVKDPLLAKAIVFSHNDTTAALVLCDIVGLAAEVSRESRENLAENFGIPAENVSIAATHSHTGPLYFGALRDQFHEVTVEREGTDPHEEFDYPAFLIEQIEAAVGQAKQNLTPVIGAAGYGHEDRIAFNRWFLMKNGRAKTWIGLNHPDVVGVAGPIDPQIGLIRFDSTADGKPLSLLTSYALHLDRLGGQLYSADFPFSLPQQLTETYGEAFVSLFGIGTCGDINHADTTAKKRNDRETIGLLLAEPVMKAMPELKPIDNPSLAVKSIVIEVPKQSYFEEQFGQAKHDMQHVGNREVPVLERVETYKIVALQDYEGETVPLEIRAIRLSDDVAMVTLP